MPPRKKPQIPLPEWIVATQGEDPSLFTALYEAWWARDFAIRQGADRRGACKASFDAAEATLDQIKFGRVTGERAWKKAAVALRKYTNAADCVRPTKRAARNEYRGLLGHA